ncbi:MAG TPA: KH domain-containing protein [Candidatus Saccharimonadales bacterium]|jgi:hypothetical protein
MNSSIDQQFVEFVVKSLVSNPDAVIVDRRIDEKGVLLELTVDPEDLGRVIGKRGATAQSIRTLLRALGTKNDARYNLKIVDNGVGGHSGSDDDSSNDRRDDLRDNTAQDRSESSYAPSSSTVTKPQDDDLDEVDTRKSAYDTTESDVIAKTRKELEAYDDLDV